jgi:hypothetical protein
VESSICVAKSSSPLAESSSHVAESSSHVVESSSHVVESSRHLAESTVFPHLKRLGLTFERAEIFDFCEFCYNTSIKTPTCNTTPRRCNAVFNP